MFRFYDPRVLFAFVLSLSAAEARAFMGSSTDVFGYHEEKLAVASMTRACADVRPTAIGVTGFAVTPVQLAAADDVAFEAYKEKLFDYFRTVWPRESEWLTDERLKEEIELAHEDAIKMMGDEPVRIGDIMDVALVRVFRPDIVADHRYWEQAMSYKNAMRSIIYHSNVTDDFRSNRKKDDLYYYKLELISYHNFGKSDPEWDYWVNEAYPDLITSTRPKNFDELYK